MIRLENIEKVYRTDRIETVALWNVNLTVDEGEFVAVMGPSGCGKSTLLNIIGLLDVPSKGRVEINGSRVASFADRELAALRNKEIGFVSRASRCAGELHRVRSRSLSSATRMRSGCC
jgi:putative ABC transport system ATP-binding protein